MLDLQQMFVNLSDSYGNILSLIYYTSYFLGMCFITKGLFSLKVYGDMRNMMSQQHSIKTPITYFVVGAILIYLPNAQEIILQSTFGDSNPMGYEPTGAMAKDASKAILGFVHIVGLISFIRGWVYLINASQQHGQQGATGKAWTHIIGGILAINIIGTKNVLWATFGLN